MARPSRQRAYGQNLPLIDVFPFPIFSASTPGASDKEYEIGQVWVKNISPSSRSSYIFGGLDGSGDAIWILSAPGASDVDTLTGDSGGAISPAGGDIILAGGTNVTTAGAGSTITFNLDATVVLATSMSSPIYTVAAATDLAINGVSGQDINIKMGDNAGANKVSFLDSDSAEVFAIDSNGGITTLTALTVAGAFTQTAGVVSISEDNSANAVGIGNGTVARAIDIGSSAAAHTITMGSVTGAASLDLLAGTGDFTITGAATTDMTIGTGLTSGVISLGATGNTGTMTISPSTTSQQLDIANANGTKTINIGSGVSGNTLSLGNGVNTSAQILNISNGASAADSTVNILSGLATSGTSTLNLGNGGYAKTIAIGDGVLGNTISMGNGVNSVAQTISIGNGASAADSTVSILSGIGTAGAGVLALGNNTRVTTIGLGDIAPAAARVITISGGDSAQNDTLSIMSDNPSANAQTVTILGGIPSGGTQVLNLLSQTGQAGTINVATGAAMANAINIGGTGANTIALGNTQAAGSVAIGDAMTTGTITIGGSGLQTGTITFGGGTGAQIVNVGTGGTGIKTVNVGTGAIDNVVTIGSVTGAASLSLLAGTGEITVTGTVKEIDAEFLEASGDEITAFSQSPLLTTAANTAGVATGANGDVNLMYCQQGVLMEEFIIGTQTIIGPRMASAGLLVSLDLTVAEGAEYNFGAGRTNSRHAFTIGTDAAFFFEVGLNIADMDGADPYIVGFRKSEANNAAFGSYSDYAAIGMIASTSAVNVVTVDEINGAGQNITNSTDTWGGDNTTNVLKVLVSAAGVVTYEVDGVAPTAAGAVTFDNADVVCPFIHLVHSASAAAVSITSMKCGFQA